MKSIVTRWNSSSFNYKST